MADGGRAPGGGAPFPAPRHDPPFLEDAGATRETPAERSGRAEPEPHVRCRARLRPSWEVWPRGLGEPGRTAGCLVLRWRLERSGTAGKHWAGFRPADGAD